MKSSAALAKENITALVRAWYRALDIHAEAHGIYKLLSAEGLSMQFPDGVITDRESFKKWYDRVTNLFFDEDHYVQSVDSTIGDNSAELRVIVGWQASMWVPPEAKSRRVSMDATQRWVVRPSNRNSFGLEIQYYNAQLEPFKYAPGFARL